MSRLNFRDISRAFGDDDSPARPVKIRNQPKRTAEVQEGERSPKGRREDQRREAFQLKRS
jgi:hypothetical protein